jgi:outer membrane immunogenic protein
MQANLKIARPMMAALGLFALGAIPAYAADVVQNEPPAPAPVETLPVASWAGPYAGINLGYGFGGKTKTEIPSNAKTDGFIGGVFGGYNWQSDNFVYGAEADIGYNGVNGSNNGVKSKGGVEGSLRARLGYAVTPEILLYGTAGGAARDVKLEDTVTGDSTSKGMFGWTAGVGTDIKLTDNVFGRVEYRYTDFGSKTFDTFGKTKVNDNRITFGIGMKF